MKYIPNTSRDKEKIYKKLGVSSFDELLEDIPKELISDKRIDIPGPLSEIEIERKLESLSAQNAPEKKILSFAGAGAYDHYVPAHIETIISRSEFLTAYTPYQPEISQGTLQTIYEYQSLICELTGLDVSNASMYDGASALAEAALMASRIKKRNKILIAGTVNPSYVKVVKTYLQGLEIEVLTIPQKNGILDIDVFKELIDENVNACVFQYPDFFGSIQDIDEYCEIASSKGALKIFSVDPIALGILESPAAFGADIITGEGQPMGIPLSFGGPYLGFFACRREYVRQMPGRVVGATTDKEGRHGFVLTLQTREQHIRREKATSNICSNQALTALAACVYLVSLGKEGIREVALQCLSKSHYAAKSLCSINSEIELINDKPFFKEFALSLPVSARDVIERMSISGIIPGVALSSFFDKSYENMLLVAVTEKRSREEISSLVSGLDKTIKQLY
ncbi:MAG: aminomethyl-transferring glycine dehydrogenase subunit GcvPA [Candidatus Schekmanbacteria bacterium]|nr:MAG: aminomethyl-transferring glycine dehydrogenase subunit GcvPA [Candidatus Schekmanbacteria bacterium]